MARHGLGGGPRVRVLVGAERHDTVDLALRYLGLGSPEPVEVDEQGRLRADLLEAALDSGSDGPVIVALQAGNVHSGAFDPFTEAIRIAHAHGAWVHVDGAFGLWAAASPAYRHLVAGSEEADSWATDAHKTLNVPYDSGIAVVRDPAALRAAMGMHGAYLIHDELGEPLDKVPEISRRGRAFPVWAVLRSLGRSGVAELVERLCRHATAFAAGMEAIPGATVLNDVVFTQVCVAFGDDARTEEVVRRLLADGTAWMTGSTWRGRSVLRISVSNWSTTDSDVERSLEAVRQAVTDLRPLVSPSVPRIPHDQDRHRGEHLTWTGNWKSSWFRSRMSTAPRGSTWSRSVPPGRRHPAHRDDAGGADDASGIDVLGDHRTRPHAAWQPIRAGRQHAARGQ